MQRNYFLAKLFVPLIKGRVYAIFEWISTISICAYFLAKLFVFKGRVFPQFYAIFGKLNFWRNINRRGPYKNGEICIILICAKKIFFGKIIYSTHQKKYFSTILGNFQKIEFLKEYRQVQTLQKWWNLCYLNLC